MLIVLVHVQVKEDSIEPFKTASEVNAKASLEEPGIARFDVLQNREEPTRFVLVEVYRNGNAPGEHKQTSHYQTWRDTVEAMMAAPRRSEKYNNVVPDDAGWNMPE